MRICPISVHTTKKHPAGCKSLFEAFESQYCHPRQEDEYMGKCISEGPSLICNIWAILYVGDHKTSHQSVGLGADMREIVSPFDTGSAAVSARGCT